MRLWVAVRWDDDMDVAEVVGPFEGQNDADEFTAKRMNEEWAIFPLTPRSALVRESDAR